MLSLITLYDSNGIRTHHHLIRKRTLNHLVKIAKIRPVWVNGLVLIYELSGCRFKSRCCHLNSRYRACFEQGVL